MRFVARSSATGLLVAAACITWADSAAAYCRTSVCGEQAAVVCVPASGADCGIPLFWRGACFGFSVQQDGSRQVGLETAEALVEQAFTTWSTVDCGAAAPSIEAVNLGSVSCGQVEYNQSSGNTNLVVFRDTEWPYAGQGNTLALTTVTFNLDDGEIFDADLELNSTVSVPLTVGDAGVQYDLASILTHEAGHMLGIAHSSVIGSTMTISYVPGDIELRSLHPDDVAAICDAYPPTEEPGICDPTPRHGFSESCGEDVVEEDCSCRSAPAPRSWGWPLALLALLVTANSRRRQRPGRRHRPSTR